MNVIDLKDKIERLDQLIRLKATGVPKQLAKKFNTTERNIYRLLNQLKEMGCPIYFDKERESYCYKNEGQIIFKFEPKSADIKAIEEFRGGVKLHKLFTLTSNVSDTI